MGTLPRPPARQRRQAFLFRRDLRLLADLRQSSLAPAARELVVYFPAAAAGHIAAALADDDDPRQADDQGGRAEQR